MPQVEKFDIRITDVWPRFMMRANLGDRHGKLVGTLISRCTNDPTKVVLREITDPQEYGEKLWQALLDDFERAARYYRREVVVVECIPEKKEFYESRGYQIVASGEDFFRMEKRL